MSDATLQSASAPGTTSTGGAGGRVRAVDAARDDRALGSGVESVNQRTKNVRDLTRSRSMIETGTSTKTSATTSAAAGSVNKFVERPTKSTTNQTDNHGFSDPRPFGTGSMASSNVSRKPIRRTGSSTPKREGFGRGTKETLTKRRDRSESPQQRRSRSNTEPARKPSTRTIRVTAGNDANGTRTFGRSPQDDYDDDDDSSSSSEEEEDEEGLDGLRRIIGGRKKVDEESTQSSDMGRRGNPLMWTVEPLADDDLRSRHSLKMPEVPKPTEANLATRMDSFMQFLSYACGRPGLTLVMCFVMTPPPSCSELDQYMVFLHPIARAAIVETDTFIRSTSRDRLSIDDCIALRRGHYLLTSSTRLLGMHLRKALADNPIKMVPTEFASVKAQEDMNNALRALIFDIERYCNLEPRGRDTFTSRVYGNKSFVQEEVDLNTEWMNVF